MVWTAKVCLFVMINRVKRTKLYFLCSSCLALPTYLSTHRHTPSQSVYIRTRRALSYRYLSFLSISWHAECWHGKIHSGRILACLGIDIAAVLANLLSCPGEKLKHNATRPAVFMLLELELERADHTDACLVCALESRAWLLLDWRHSCWTQNAAKPFWQQRTGNGVRCGDQQI